MKSKSNNISRLDKFFEKEDSPKELKTNYKKPFDKCLAFYQSEIDSIWEENHPKDSYYSERSGSGGQEK
jgi:hypothetical protein